MKLNRKWILVMALVMSVALATGGTLAYLTDTEKEVNVMTVGRVDIELLEQQRNEKGDALVGFEDGQKLMPIVGEGAQGTKDAWGLPDREKTENFVDKIVRVENKGNNDAYLRVFVAVPAAFQDLKGDGSGNTTDDIIHTSLGNRFDKDMKGTYNTGSGWTSTWDWYPAYDAAVKAGDFKITLGGVDYWVTEYTYGVLKAGEMTDALLCGAYMDYRADWDDEKGQYFYAFEDGTVEYADYDATNGIVIPVVAQAVQVEGFATAKDAFEKAIDKDDKVGKLTALLEGSMGITKANDQAGFEAALAGAKKGDTVYLESGSYAFKSIPEGVTITGADGVKVSTIAGGMKDVTLNNVTFEGSEHGARWSYPKGTVTFNDCTFTAANGGSYAFHADQCEGEELIFNNCTFNKGIVATGSGATTATYRNCTFNFSSVSAYGNIRAYIESDFYDCTVNLEGAKMYVTEGVTATVKGGSMATNIVRAGTTYDLGTLRIQ